MFGYIWVYSMSSDCNMLYTIYTPKAVSTCLIISGYIQCPPTVTCCFLYILLWRFQPGYIQCRPTIPFCILYIAFRRFRHVWLYLGFNQFGYILVSTSLVLSVFQPVWLYLVIFNILPPYYVVFYIYPSGSFIKLGYMWVC